MGSTITTLLILLMAQPATGEVAAIRDFERRCDEEGRRVWAASLCAPIVVVDPRNGSVWTSRAAPSAPLPGTRANTALKWGGEDWIMLLQPLPADAAKLRSLLFHEAWHVRQQALGFPGNTAVAPHLEEPRERYLLRLEWAALAAALRSEGLVQRDHIAQALAFRQQRLAKHREWFEAELDQFRHEGMAAYTGTVLSGSAEKLALEELAAGGARAALARSFAYVSGPAWGLLLDQHRPDWKRRIGSQDISELMGIAASHRPRPDDYGGTPILLEETKAAAERRTRIDTARASTAEGRALRLPLKKMNMDFDPNRVLALGDQGTVYEKIRLTDAWGEVRTDGLPLRINSDFSSAYVPWPSAREALQLLPGWRIEETEGGQVRLVAPPAERERR